jgi:hypothetical protein
MARTLRDLGGFSEGNWGYWAAAIRGSDAEDVKEQRAWAPRVCCVS